MHNDQEPLPGGQDDLQGRACTSAQHNSIQAGHHHGQEEGHPYYRDPGVHGGPRRGCNPITLLHTEGVLHRPAACGAKRSSQQPKEPEQQDSHTCPVPLAPGVHATTMSVCDGCIALCRHHCAGIHRSCSCTHAGSCCVVAAVQQPVSHSSSFAQRSC